MENGKLANGGFDFQVQQRNWLSLQRSEMFIARKAHPKDLAPVGAKLGSRESGCAPLELSNKEEEHRL
jgi:hypothetical protein